MRDIYDLLIAGRMLGGGSPAPTPEPALAEGTLPLTFNITKNHLFDFRIYGNTVTAKAPNIFNSSFKNGAYATANGTYSGSFTQYLCTSTRVPVKASTDYLVSVDASVSTQQVTVLFYTSAGAYISYSEAAFSAIVATTPSNCAYIHINIKTPNAGVQPSVINKVTVYETAASSNLFDSSTATRGYTFNSSGNTQTQYSEDWYATDYIPIFAGKLYYLSGGTASNLAYDVFYDAQKNVLSTFTCVAQKWFIPSADGYIRCSINNPMAFAVVEYAPAPNVSQGVGEFAEPDNYAAFELPISCTSGDGTINSTISLGSSRLANGDYVDFGTQQRVNADTTTENIEIAPIKTNIGENSMDTSTNVKPSNVKIEYI